MALKTRMVEMVHWLVGNGTGECGRGECGGNGVIEKFDETPLFDNSDVDGSFRSLK
jgi:hypothetical protein